VFDVFGSYQPALIAASVMFVAGAGLFLALGRYPPASTPPMANGAVP
jgi:hypothetical protein